MSTFSLDLQGSVVFVRYDKKETMIPTRSITSITIDRMRCRDTTITIHQGDKTLITLLMETDMAEHKALREKCIAILSVVPT